MVSVQYFIHIHTESIIERSVLCTRITDQGRGVQTKHSIPPLSISLPLGNIKHCTILVNCFPVIASSSFPCMWRISQEASSNFTLIVYISGRSAAYRLPNVEYTPAVAVLAVSLPLISTDKFDTVTIRLLDSIH